MFEFVDHQPIAIDAQALQSKFELISGLTDEFCERHLNAEYAELARVAIAALCRKRPSPLSRGGGDGWACGVIHALGMVNFLFDPDQSPHLDGESGKGSNPNVIFGCSVAAFMPRIQHSAWFN